MQFATIKIRKFTGYYGLQWSDMYPMFLLQTDYCELPTRFLSIISACMPQFCYHAQSCEWQLRLLFSIHNCTIRYPLIAD